MRRAPRAIWADYTPRPGANGCCPVWPPGGAAERVSGRTEKGVIEMGIGLSLAIIVTGALLVWAAAGWNTIGWILLIVGGVGVLLSLVFWSTWGGIGSRRERVTSPR